jgi:hypothetical protein
MGSALTGSSECGRKLAQSHRPATFAADAVAHGLPAGSTRIELVVHQRDGGA